MYEELKRKINKEVDECYRKMHESNDKDEYELGLIFQGSAAGMRCVLGFIENLEQEE